MLDIPKGIKGLQQLADLSSLDMYAYVRTQGDHSTLIQLLKKPLPPLTWRKHLHTLATHTYLRILINDVTSFSKQ
jgi:hypothetical protein